MKRTLLFTIILLLTALARPGMTVLGQTASPTGTQKPAERSAGSITGRVVNETGHPMPNVRVFVGGMGRQAVRRTVITDEAGRYVADALPRGSYGVSAQASGYVFARDPRDPFHYRPGETANLTLKKGAVITGAVTNSDGEPVVGVPISATLVRDTQGRPIGAPSGLTRYTDDRGVYRLFGLSAGTYIVAAGTRIAGTSMLTTAYGDDAPTYYPSSTRDTAAEISLQYGAEATGIDIRYRGERGYAVSGSITDTSATDPLVVGVDVQGRQNGFDSIIWQDSQTDDRGVYRIFGVPEGRYIVSVGEPPNQRSASLGPGNTYYAMTFHPGVTDESKATVIELAAEAESTGVDIVVGRAEKGFTVKGRIVDAETGTPVSNISYGYGIFYEGRGMGGIGGFGARSDPQGDFRLDGVPPNHYAAFVVKESESEYYSDLTPFDVADADVSGLEIKVRRGASITGVAVIEGLPGGDMSEKLAGLRIRAFVQSTELGAPFSSPSKIAADGSFRITGLRAGKVKLSIGGYPLPKGFALTRVERDEAEQRDGSFEIAAGEQLSGVRVTFAYGTAVIRGQLKITGGPLPQGTRSSVTLKLAGTNSSRPDWWTEVDDRNRFLFEDLPPGDYELIVAGYINVPGAPASRVPKVKRRVTVNNNGETEITIVIDSRAKDN